jgi:hypothetical protein
MDWRPIVNRYRLFPAAPACLSLIFPASGGSTGWRWKLVDALWEWGCLGIGYLLGMLIGY